MVGERALRGVWTFLRRGRKRLAGMMRRPKRRQDNPRTQDDGRGNIYPLW